MARKPATVHGTLIVDKPFGPTSHAVIGMLRRRFGERRIGHAGTLDPAATGVLVVGVGAAARLLRFATAGRKHYECEIVFGTATTTQDGEGEIVGTWPLEEMALDPGSVAAAAQQFVGEIEQLPPMYSAVHVGGRRLHELARAGEDVEREPRSVEVHRFEVNSGAEPNVFRAEVECSAGTYVRTLGADLGSALGGGAHIRNLRRIASGSFHASEAAPPEAAELLRVGELVRDLSHIQLSDAEAERVLVGGHLVPERYEGDGPWALFAPDGELAAVHEFAQAGGSQRRPIKATVLNR